MPALQPENFRKRFSVSRFHNFILTQSTHKKLFSFKWLNIYTLKLWIYNTAHAVIYAKIETIQLLLICDWGTLSDISIFNLKRKRAIIHEKVCNWWWLPNRTNTAQSQTNTTRILSYLNSATPAKNRARTNCTRGEEIKIQTTASNCCKSTLNSL